jgi:HEAT repeat protein
MSLMISSKKKELRMGLKKKLVSLVFLVSSPCSLFAAINKNQSMDVDAILAMPAKQIEALNPESSPGMVNQLKQRAFDRDQGLSIRWKALVLAAKIGGSAMNSELKEASRSNEWYMRTASLAAASQISFSDSLVLARKLVNDKALVVRSAAVDIIGDSDDPKDRDLLWTVIDDPKNKRKGQSLWIRSQTLNWLIKQPTRKDIPSLIKILKEDDVEMNVIAINGLEKISDFKFGYEQESLAEKKQRWLSWWDLNGKTRNL